jgi:hypothetical protein
MVVYYTESVTVSTNHRYWQAIPVWHFVDIDRTSDVNYSLTVCVWFAM